MSKAKMIVDLLWYAEPVVSCMILGFLFYSKQARVYWGLTAFAILRVISVAVLFTIISTAPHVRSTEISTHYRVYFYTYWSFYLVESVLIFLTIQSLFRLAMEPLKGLQRMGLLIFRWAAIASLALAVATSIGPHVSSTKFIIAAASEIQRAQSILTLCLLLFLCLAAKPLGLNYRSRIFGISLGFGLMASMDLVQSAWLTQHFSLFSANNIIKGSVMLGALLLWTGYFAIPEPKRKLITLPLRSPLLRWNDIALALGNPEVHVAVGNLGADVFADAELQMMRTSLRSDRLAS